MTVFNYYAKLFHHITKKFQSMKSLKFKDLNFTIEKKIDFLLNNGMTLNQVSNQKKKNYEWRDETGKKLNFIDKNLKMQTILAIKC